MESFKQRGRIYDESDGCEGLIECVVFTICHEFVHAIISCDCMEFASTNDLLPGTRDWDGLIGP